MKSMSPTAKAIELDIPPLSCALKSAYNDPINPRKIIKAANVINQLLEKQKSPDDLFLEQTPQNIAEIFVRDPAVAVIALRERFGEPPDTHEFFAQFTVYSALIAHFDSQV